MTWTQSFRAEASAPESMITLRTAVSSDSIVTTASRSNAEAIDGRTVTPSSVLVAANVRFHTLTRWPALTRLGTIAAPMLPIPINPISIARPFCKSQHETSHEAAGFEQSESEARERVTLRSTTLQHRRRSRSLYPAGAVVGSSMPGWLDPGPRRP